MQAWAPRPQLTAKMNQTDCTSEDTHVDRARLTVMETRNTHRGKEGDLLSELKAASECREEKTALISCYLECYTDSNQGLLTPPLPSQRPFPEKCLQNK